jgi:hypothetical protein
MSTCAECDGVGGFEVRACGHSGNCPCPTFGRAECDACEGSGRRCGACLESLELSAPDDATECAGCRTEAQRETKDESEVWT